MSAQQLLAPSSSSSISMAVLHVLLLLGYLGKAVLCPKIFMFCPKLSGMVDWGSWGAASQTKEGLEAEDEEVARGNKPA